MNAHQRAALMALFLWQGSRLTNADVARLCGMTRRGAAYMMETLSASLPIRQSEGKWHWMAKDDK